MTLHQESHSESHPWIKCVFEPFPEAYGWANFTLQCAPLLPCLTQPSSSFRPCNLCQEPHDLSHQHSPQHHPDCFDFSIDISDHPTCMHFSWLTSNGKRVSTNDGHEKHSEKKKISHSVPGALCATIMFTLCSMSSGSGQHSCICLCMSSCPHEDIAFRKKPMRDIPLPLRGQRHGGHWCAGGL